VYLVLSITDQDENLDMGCGEEEDDDDDFKKRRMGIGMRRVR
jgi:hypothetical protein